jgi:hypothetical protein
VATRLIEYGMKYLDSCLLRSVNLQTNLHDLKELNRQFRRRERGEFGSLDPLALSFYLANVREARATSFAMMFRAIVFFPAT